MTVQLGARVVVVGGGNTAVDAARTARRIGAEVTILYRRTRQEMPAIDSEVEDALTEGVGIEFLAAPIEIKRENGTIRSVVVRQMALGEPDASGRRTPVPIPGSEFEVTADSVIAAVSQQPDWGDLAELKPATMWMEAAPDGECREGVWTGGDSRGLGVAGMAIGQGRQAAEAAHARLRGRTTPLPPQRIPVLNNMVKSDFYAGSSPVAPPRRPPEAWLVSPQSELQGSISEEEFQQEASRCFSCGLCYGCEQCFMYCNAEGLVRLAYVTPGRYFALRLDRCQACGKCVDLCPCGFLGPS
jgi:formate dehydrogenase major subunit